MIIDGRDFEWIWETNRYDVPLNGFVRYRGQIYEVERVGDWEDGEVKFEARLLRWYEIIQFYIQHAFFISWSDHTAPT